MEARRSGERDEAFKPVRRGCVPGRQAISQGVAGADGRKKVSVNGIDIFLLEAQDAAWLASYEWNIRARFITS